MAVRLPRRDFMHMELSLVLLWWVGCPLGPGQLVTGDALGWNPQATGVGGCGFDIVSGA